MWPDEEDLATYETGAPLDPTAPEKPYGRTPMDYYGAAVIKYPDPDGVYVMLANANWYWFNREPVVTTVRDDMDVVRTETQQIYRAQPLRRAPVGEPRRSELPALRRTPALPEPGARRQFLLAHDLGHAASGSDG